jgi:hypothetical protein
MVMCMVNIVYASVRLDTGYWVWCLVISERLFMAKRYRVIKRDGESAPLEIAKIRKVIQWVAEELDIKPIELESNLKFTFVIL